MRASQIDDDEMVFGAQLQGSTLKIVRQVFRNIMSVDDVIFQVSEDGVKFTVEQGGVIQESLFIPSEWFPKYFVKKSDNDNQPLTFTFAVDLTSLTGVLQMTKDDDCQLMMVYYGDNHPFFVTFAELADSKILIEAELRTKSYVEPMRFLREDRPTTKNTVKMSGSNFANLFNDIDVSSERVEIQLSSEKGHLCLRATGRIHAEAIVQVAKSSNAFRYFECLYNITESFRNAHIRTASKCLSIAHEVTLELFTTGLLSIELFIDKHTQQQDTNSLHRTAGNLTTVNNPSIAGSAMARIKYFIVAIVNDDD